MIVPPPPILQLQKCQGRSTGSMKLSSVECFVCFDLSNTKCLGCHSWKKHKGKTQTSTQNVLFSIERKSFGQFLKHTSRFQFGRLHSLTHLTLKLNIDDNSAVTVFIEIFLILRFAKLPYFAKFLFFQSRWSPCISNSFLAFPFLPFLILWKLEMSGSH